MNYPKGLKKHLLTVALLLFLHLYGAEITSGAEVSGLYVRRFQWDGTATLTLRASEPGKVFVELIMDSYGCAGGIDGFAQVKDKIIKLTNSYEDRICDLTIMIEANSAVIRESQDCFWFHGARAGCTFDGTYIKKD